MNKHIQQPDRDRTTVVPMSKTKQEKISDLSKVSGILDDAYFVLEEFNGLDVGSNTRRSILDAMDGVAKIRRKILEIEEPNNLKTYDEKEI